MIVPDVNLLVYAYDTRSRFHALAREWWTNCLNGEEEVGIATVTLFGFVRIVTSARIVAEPMSVEEATEHVESWIEPGRARVIEATYPARVFDLLKDVGTGGNLVTDAQIAAIAIEEGGVVHTADMDFRRFKGVKVVFPLEAR